MYQVMIIVLIVLSSMAFFSPQNSVNEQGAIPESLQKLLFDPKAMEAFFAAVQASLGKAPSAVKGVGPVKDETTPLAPDNAATADPTAAAAVKEAAQDAAYLAEVQHNATATLPTSMWNDPRPTITSTLVLGPPPEVAIP